MNPATQTCKAAKVDAIFVSNKTNIRYLANFDGSNGFLLLKPRVSYLFTDFRYHGLARKVLPTWIKLVDMERDFGDVLQKTLAKAHVKKLGFEASDMSHALYEKLDKKLSGIRLKNIGNSVSELRIQKRVDELTKLKKAQAITDEIYKILKYKIRAGMSEQDIAWLIETLAHELGAENISFTPIVAIKEHAANPHHHNTTRKLKKGEPILIDMGVLFKGYCSDMTRIIFTSKPIALEQELYTVTLEAQETALSALKANVIGAKIDKIARDIIDDAGYKGLFGHSLGHGVGMDVHELPNLASSFKGKIPESSIVTVEPGIYVDGKFGVRLEDMTYVTKDGNTNLTKSPKTIEACTISL